MDTLYLGAGESVFAFLGESKLNIIAGVILLAFALWSLVAIITAFAAAPRRKSVRLALFTVINVIISVVLIAYSAVVALEKAGVIAVASSVPTDNAFLSAVVNLITLGAEHELFEYGLYGSAVLAVVALVLTLARARRQQFISPVAKAKDDGYVVVDDGAIETTPGSEPAEEEPTVSEPGLSATPVPDEEPETEEDVKENEDETEELEAENESREEAELAESGTETPETGKPDEAPEVADNADEEDEESAIPVSVAEKRIADMGSVLGKLDDLFTLSAADADGSAYIGSEAKREQSAPPDIPAPAPEKNKISEIGTAPEAGIKTEKGNEDPDSVENILSRILGSTGGRVKPAPRVVAEGKTAAKKKDEKIEVTAEVKPEVADPEPAPEPVAQKPEPKKTESPIVTESVISDAAVDKTEARRARRVRTIGRAAELFDEYLSAQSDDEKKKLTDSIDCIVVDKNKK